LRGSGRLGHPPRYAAFTPPSSPNLPHSSVDAIAALIRETPSADRDALICSIVSRWPDTTAEEIELALELASALEVELIDR
jgi:hypothetical protein